MTRTKKRRVFPFTAVIGQEEMKLALLLNVIDPRIGGVMIMGDRGIAFEGWISFKTYL